MKATPGCDTLAPCQITTDARGHVPRRPPLRARRAPRSTPIPRHKIRALAPRVAAHSHTYARGDDAGDGAWAPRRATSRHKRHKI